MLSSFSAEIDFRCKNLTSIDIWKRTKTALGFVALETHVDFKKGGTQCRHKGRRWAGTQARTSADFQNMSALLSRAANTGDRACVGWMFGQRRRRWPNIQPTQAQCPAFGGIRDTITCPGWADHLSWSEHRHGPRQVNPVSHTWQGQWVTSHGRGGAQYCASYGATSYTLAQR